MGCQFRQLCAIVEVPLDRDLSADEPPLHLHRGLQTGARALLPSRRHLCRARMVSVGGARSLIFQGVLLELKIALNSYSPMKLDWIVEIDCIACSFESWEPQRAPIPWRSRAPVEEPSTASEVD